MTLIPFISPLGKIFNTYEHRVPLTGTGPFSIGEYYLPNGWTAGIVGTTLVFSGYPDEVLAAIEASFEIFSCCDCDPVTLTTTITINSGCTYSWSMIPTIAPVGTPIKTTFTAPKTCPADAVLRLAVFHADGITPYIELAISPEPLVITIPTGSSTYVVQASDANADLIFKPDVEQSACLLTCTPSNLRQRRIVPPRSDCNIVWSFSTYQFAAEKPTAQTFTITGLPVGGLAAFDLYVGNVLQDYGDFVLTYDSPSVTVGPLSFPTAVIGVDFNYRPRSPLLGTAVGCRILPIRKDFDVVTGTICAITWKLDTRAFTAGKSVPQTYSATGIPVGGAVSFDLYVDDALQSYGDFTLTNEIPSLTANAIMFPVAAIGSNYNYRPRVPSLGTAAACRLTPTKIPFTVAGLVCAIAWKLETTTFTATKPSHQTYTATGIPAGGAVVFDLYVGSTLQNYGDFTLTAEVPSVSPGDLTFPVGVAGLDFNYRPRVPSLGYASTCTVSPARISFAVNSLVCAVAWRLETDAFVSGVPKHQTYTATGIPPNGAVAFDLYVGDVLQNYGNFTLTADVPSTTPGNLTFPDAVVGLDFNYRPRIPSLGSALSCSVSPAKVPFRISAGVASTCSVNWGMLTTVFTANVAAPQKFTATGLVPGSSLTLTFFDTGVAQTYGSVVLDYANPIITIASPLTFLSGSIGKDYSYHAVLTTTSTTSNCVLAPSVIAFRVQAAADSATGAPSTSVNSCAANTYESGTSSSFPITWRENASVPKYNQVATTQFTDSHPLVIRASIPFTILSGATSLGATSMPFILDTAGAGAASTFARVSVSRNRCDFTAAAGVTYPMGSAVSHSNTFSVNDATLAGGGEFNLTTGQWFYNIELVGTLPSNYNANRLLDFHWYA